MYGNNAPKLQNYELHATLALVGVFTFLTNLIIA